MSSPAIQELRAVNARLRTRWERLRGGYDRPVIISPSEFTDLLGDLLGVADSWRTLQAAPALDPQLANEMSEYRNQLEQLAKILPRVQGRLLVEQARLQTLQSHMNAAKAWAEASRKTL